MPLPGMDRIIRWSRPTLRLVSETKVFRRARPIRVVILDPGQYPGYGLQGERRLARQRGDVRHAAQDHGAGERAPGHELQHDPDERVHFPWTAKTV